MDTELHPIPRLWMANMKQRELFSSFPLFFRAVHHPESYLANISHFGIQCGVGWYPIIEALARDIEAELRTLWREQLQFPEQIAQMDRALLHGRATYPALPLCTDVTQVGGELTVVLLSGQLCPPDVESRIRARVQIAVSGAWHVCESCGKPGELRKGYWHRVYCDKCIAPVADLVPADPLG
ncbi:hypothetical protein [Burkholderia multivorans]|uniref:hypothetical protein n=1 Tax=Burkholderia multivorans TaxID=87883 RepID=UPI001C269613|nr:hypothetical protein [Burkholderia multivorans]MBU9552882.1 hypothetical protein [Burkholderia multivorans]